MKKGTLITLGVIVALIIIGFIYFKNSYNSMLKSEVGVSAQWSQVENQYQRRTDLIPNLVATVKGYAEHEKDVLVQVVEARAKATQTTIDASNLTAENMAQFQKAQDGLSGALSRLLVSVEKYPDLKANQNFLSLQTQLEGTENRISTERMRFNEAVKAYDLKIRTFPNNLLAGMFGFEKKAYFKAIEGAEVPVEVKF